MASSALIDDLLKQFAENPRRVFARLANEYRKNGELDTAIEICRAHVPLQPTYISGYIVLGQALFESGQLDEARATFETALGLDPENLIALRQLGDIAKANGDTAGARAWYRRLLEVDPQNDEIAVQLRELDAPAAAAPETAAVSDAALGISWSDIHPEHEANAAAQAPEAPQTSAVMPEAPPAAPEHVPPAPTPAPPALDFDFEVLSSFGGEGAPAQPAAEAADAPPPVAPSSPFGQELMLDRDDAGAVEEEPALAPEPVPEPIAAEMPALSEPELVADMAIEPITLESEPEAEPEPHAPSELPSASFAAEPQADVVDEPLPAAFITETMAELYLQQGHREQALDIYRLLVAQRPGDLSLLNRIARLEHTAPPAAPERTVRAFFGRFAARRPPGQARESAAEVVDTPSVDTPSVELPPVEVADEAEPAAFAVEEPVVERAREVDIESFAYTNAESVTAAPTQASEPEGPVVEAEPETEVAPTMSEPALPVEEPAAPEPPVAMPQGASPFAELFAGRIPSAADETAAATLASAYGAESMPASAGQPTRAADDALSLDDVFGGGAGEPEHDTVSFDEFFASPNGSAPAASAADEHAAPSPDAPRGDDTDLELFHAWLEGLKK